MNLKLIRYILIVVIFSSCAKVNKNKTFSITPKEILHTEGMQLLELKKFDKAASKFKLIFEQHPESKDLAESELMYAYSLYLGAKYQDAYDVYQNWLLYFPVHKSNVYVRYMIFRCFYNQINDVLRDQSFTKKSLESFAELESYGKNNIYYQDAVKKIPIIYDYLAAEQMYIAVNQVNMNNIPAAINRFKSVFKYKNTIHIPEALYRITECYIILGIPSQAAKYFAILNYNYPDSIWNQHSMNIFSNYTWYKQYNKYLKYPKVPTLKTEDKTDM